MALGLTGALAAFPGMSRLGDDGGTPAWATLSWFAENAGGTALRWAIATWLACWAFNLPSRWTRGVTVELESSRAAR